MPGMEMGMPGRPGFASRVSSRIMIRWAGSGAKSPASERSAETVTDWFWAASWENWIFSIWVRLGGTESVRMAIGKPGYSAVRRYSPASMAGKEKRPWASVFVSWRPESARRTRRRVAPESGRAWGSVRVPARSAAANVGAAARTEATSSRRLFVLRNNKS